MTHPQRTYARVTDIITKETFLSSADDQLSAVVHIQNDSEIPHSCQIVFRGYLKHRRDSRNKEETDLVYEFLHEQAWVIAKQGESSHEVAVDAWLSRFPPTMQISSDNYVEYSVRASIDPWFVNTHMEKIFKVERSLTLKLPHKASLPTEINVNECVGHGGWCHRKCEPINGQLWIDKGAYTHGEDITVRWKLQSESPITEAKIGILKSTEYRLADPGHPMLVDTSLEEINTESKKYDSETVENTVTINVPKNLATSIDMSLWNVLMIKYCIWLNIKTKSFKKGVDFKIPVFVTSEKLQKPRHSTENDENMYRRAIDIDDDTQDDDDYDSELDELEPMLQRERYSIDIDDLQIVIREGGDLTNAYAEVTFTVNSKIPRPLHSLRLLMTGECRAGMVWYDFMRYKSIVTTNSESAFSPGQHKIKISLPFLESQYDTHILPPSMGEDIKYTVKVSTRSWRINQIPVEREFYVGRFVDTWAREEFKGGFSEKVGKFGITMTQCNFMKGKYIFCKIYGPAKSVRLQLTQQRRLRLPGLQKDESYRTERIVSTYESPRDPRYWPEDWSLKIPDHIQPSIEVSYWNVVVISYVFQTITVAEDGHEHIHTVPVWIGSTDDKLGPPAAVIAPPPIEDILAPPLDELPEFEVVKSEPVHEHPWWVQRLNEDTYYEPSHTYESQ